MTAHEPAGACRRCLALSPRQRAFRQRQSTAAVQNTGEPASGFFRFIVQLLERAWQLPNKQEMRATSGCLPVGLKPRGCGVEIVLVAKLSESQQFEPQCQFSVGK